MWKLAERFTEACKQGSLMTSASVDQTLKVIHTSIGWVSLARLTSKAKTNMKKNWLALFPDCVSQLLSSSFYQHTWRTVDHMCEILSCPAHVWAPFLTAHTGLSTSFWLCVHQTGSIRSAYNLVERFTNRSKVWNLAVAYINLQMKTATKDKCMLFG